MLNGRLLNQSPCVFQKCFSNKDTEYQYPKVNVKKLLSFLLKIKQGEISLNMLINLFFKKFSLFGFCHKFFFPLEKIYQYMDIYGLYGVLRYFST